MISIALIAIVAVAALYNGGDAFRQGSANASAAQLVNAGQQISAANILYANDNSGSYADSVSDLTLDGAYLSSEPRVPNGFVVTDDLTKGATESNYIEIVSTEASPEVCEAVNKQAGYDEADLTNGALADAASVDKTFGCYSADGTTHTFEFK